MAPTAHEFCFVLSNILDNSDDNESKHLFECNYSSIYQIFYESFISVETNLKQRGTYNSYYCIIIFLLFLKILILTKLDHKYKNNLGT